MLLPIGPSVWVHRDLVYISSSMFLCDCLLKGWFKMRHGARKTLMLLLTCCVLATLFTAAFVLSASAASVTYNANVSSSKVTKSTNSGSLPSSVSKVTGGKSYYFNLQTSNSIYITSAALYVKVPGASSYKKVYTKKSTSGVHYVAYSYSVNNTKGTLYYYWKTDYKTSSSSSSKKVKSSSTKSVTVTASKTVYKSALKSFLSNSKWKVGTKWGSSQTPKASSYSPASGCCAYVADLVYKVYGKSTPRSGTSFTSASEIQAGDVLYMTQTKKSKDHWVYVWGRSGNTLYVVEANWETTVTSTTGTYYVSGKYVYRGSVQLKLNKGYHYEP